MKRLIVALPLICSGLASASTLELGDNVVALAASKAKVSIFSKTIKLPDGHNSLVISFDSQANPESVNQGKGRITSAPYIISFSYTGNETILLSAGKVNDENEAKKQASNPSFSLTVNNNPIKYDLKKVDKDSVNIFSNFKSLLATEQGVSSLPDTTSDATGSLTEAISAYNKLTDKQKIAFMKWLMTN